MVTDAPMLDILDEGHLAEPLHHRVIVDDDEGCRARRSSGSHRSGWPQVEAARFPIAARQVLAAARDRAVRLDEARAADPDDRGQTQPCRARPCRSAPSACRPAAPRPVRDSARRRHGARGRTSRPLACDRSDALSRLSLTTPARILVPPMSTARMPSWPASIQAGIRWAAPMRPGLVGMMADRFELDVEPLRLEDHGGARDGELADTALPEAAAGDDRLGILPVLDAQEAADDAGQLLGEFLDDAMDQGRRLGVAAEQDRVELLLGEVLGRHVARADPRRTCAASGANPRASRQRRACWHGRR